MNFEFFISKRIIAAKQYKSNVSGPIIKIAIVAIALGMIMMLIAVSAGIGLQQKIQEKVAAFNGHIIISKHDNNISEISANPIGVNDKFYNDFKSVSGIQHIQAVANKGGGIRTATDFEGINLKGVGPDYDWQYFSSFLKEGRLPKVDGNKENNELLISEYLANRLGLKLNDVAVSYFPKKDLDKMPNRRNFKIVGIYNSGFQDFDKAIVLADIRHVQRMNKWNRNKGDGTQEVGSVEVFLNDFSELEHKGEEIYQNTNSFLKAQTISDKYYAIFEWLKVIDFNIYIMIGVMILISIINMSVMLLVMILEKTQLIGTLKALGTNNWSVQKIFLYNAGYIVLVGLFWGNLIGCGFLWLQSQFKFFPLDPETYYVTEVPVYFNIGYVIFLNIGTFLICMLMLQIPSYIITKISPIKAIRFD